MTLALVGEVVQGIRIADLREYSQGVGSGLLTNLVAAALTSKIEFVRVRVLQTTQEYVSLQKNLTR